MSEQRLTRLERTVYGSDDEPQNGIVSRLHLTEATVTEIRDVGRKIIWLIIAGVVVGLMNLLLNSGRVPSVNNTSQNVGIRGTEPATASSKAYLRRGQEDARPNDRASGGEVNAARESNEANAEVRRGT